MKQNIKLLVTALALFGAGFTQSFAWEWSNLNPLTGFGYFTGEDTPEATVEDIEDVEGASESEEGFEEIDADAEEDSDEPDFEEDVVIFNFESLGIELLPVQSDFLKGTAAEQAEQIRIFIQMDAVEGGVSQYVSLYRANPALAIEVLEKELKMNERMLLIKSAPVAFVGKLLSDMGKNVDGIEKEFYHWGSFVMKNDAYGMKEIDRALIPASARPVHYIWAIIMHGAESDEDIQEGAKFIFQVLTTLGDDDVVNLLAYTPEEASAKIGKKQKKVCFGRLKREGLCLENSPQYLPVEFVAAILPGFSDYMIFTTLEKEETHNPARAKEIINRLNPGVYKRILPHLGIKMKKKVSAENIAASNPLMAKYKKDNQAISGNLIASGPAEEEASSEPLVLQAGPIDSDEDEAADEHYEL